MEVVVTTGAVSRAKLPSNHHHQQTNIQFFTGQIPFLSPNQQCQSTEGKSSEGKRPVKRSATSCPQTFIFKWPMGDLVQPGVSGGPVCKIRISYYVSGHRGHRRWLCDSPAYLGRPDPLSYKWIGRQFKWGLARRNWPSFCVAGVRPILGPDLYVREWKATDVCMPIRWARFGSVDVRLCKDEVSTIVRRRTLYGR